MHLRFVSGRPVSPVPPDFLEWWRGQMQAQGKRARRLIWENASWPVSNQVKTWPGEHHQSGLQEARTDHPGARHIPCWFPTKRPGRNRIEPKGGMASAPSSSLLGF
jgi:hypothetical protein